MLNNLMLSIPEIIVLEFGQLWHNSQQFLLQLGCNRIGANVVIPHFLKVIAHGLNAFGDEPAVGVGFACCVEM
jgi:hypothetical protein